MRHAFETRPAPGALVEANARRQFDLDALLCRTIHRIAGMLPPQPFRQRIDLVEHREAPRQARPQVTRDVPRKGAIARKGRDCAITSS